MVWVILGCFVLDVVRCFICILFCSGGWCVVIYWFFLLGCILWVGFVWFNFLVVWFWNCFCLVCFCYGVCVGLVVGLFFDVGIVWMLDVGWIVFVNLGICCCLRVFLVCWYGLVVVLWGVFDWFWRSLVYWYGW